MLKQVCKIGCLVMVLGLLSFPAWSSDNAGMNTDRLSILPHGGYGPGDCGRVNINDNRLILARGGNGGYGPGDGTGNDGEGPGDGTGNGPGSDNGEGNGGTGDNGGYGPGDGEGNDGEGPEDGTGYGPGEPGYGPGPGDCPVIVSG
ncbi:MAG TPA: hypothetical protein VMW89_04005 [Desulfatiglandales bacterium]|nr:hypothetical protein [Desulfatiglandales bacterium]